MNFARLEREAWQNPSVAVTYAEQFPPVTGHVADPLLDAVRADPGELLADIACGPGTVSVRAAARGSRVIGLDFSREMLRLASRGPHPPTPVQGSATRLPFAGGRFDAVVTNFGLLHFADPANAISEAVRILRKGGRAGWSVWGEDALALQLIPQTLESLGLAPPLPAGPGFFQYGTPDRFEAALAAAGLISVQTQRLAWAAPFQDPSAFWRAFSDGTARTRAAIRALNLEDRERLRAEVERRVGEFSSPSGLSVPTTAIIAAGIGP
jgi:SAM-dependent methyltransferase